MSKYHEFYTILILILLILFAAIILIGMIEFSNDVLQEIAHINIEIKRTTGSEKEYWKKRRRRLCLSFLFFIKY